MNNSIASLAQQFNLSSQDLIDMLEKAGISGKTADDEISSDEKLKLISELRPKVQITRPPQSSVLETRSGGSSHEIKVTVRRKPRDMISARKIRTVVEPEETKTPVAEEPVQDAVQPEEKVVVEPAAMDTAPVEDIQIDGAAATPEAPEEPTTEVSERTEVQEAESAPEKPVDAVVEPPVAKKVKSKMSPAPDGEKARKRKFKGKAAKYTTDNLEKLHVSKPTRRRRKRSSRNDQKTVAKAQEHQFTKPTDPVIHEVPIAESMVVSELASQMSVKSAEVIETLMELGEFKTINDSVDASTATAVVELMGHIPVKAERKNIEQNILEVVKDDEREQFPRPPVVAVMGHVDHGKTTLLDYIRETKVAAGEHGGITQHIGAYVVDSDKGKITFIDTPGHEAFSAMRIRGAQATDIVVLVVASDDGVKPQTVEAINHAKNAQVPIVVAINKIDKNSADPERVVRELTEREIVVEELGGDVQSVQVSALTGQGMDDLLEKLILESEVLELQAPTSGVSSGLVIESRVDTGRGPVATVLVQKGTLRQGDIVVAGLRKGRIRALKNDHGMQVKLATPSTPVEIEGLDDVPMVGDTYVCVPNDKDARDLVDFRSQQVRQQSGRQNGEIIFGDGDDSKTLNVLIKADVRGSAEALSSAIKKLATDEVEVKVIHESVGGINQSDANLAITANAIILAFNVRADAPARRLIEENKIKVFYNSVIYESIEEVEGIIAGIATPKVVEEVVGLVEVREIFRVNKVGTIAGCYVQDGAVRRNSRVRVLRNDVVIHQGTIDSLRRFKNDVSEVKAGFECGIGVKNFQDIEMDDRLEVYQINQ